MAFLPLIMLVVGASPAVYVTASGDSASACNSAALANAVHTLRPNLHVEQERPGAAGLHLSLRHAGVVYVLQLRGRDVKVDRSFADDGDCEAAVRTAALIVDGALDDLTVRGQAPRIDALIAPKPPPPLEFLVSLTGGADQAPVAVAPVFGVDLQLRRGWFEAGLSGDVVPPARSPIIAGTDLGSYVATEVAAEASAGIGPRLGPGWLSLDAAFGWEVTFMQVSSQELFHEQQATAVEPFAAVRAGYMFQLPWQLFLGARFEERLALQQFTFAVQGENSQLSTRIWTAVGLVVLGRRFF